MDEGIFEAVRKKNRLRWEMGRASGEERKAVDEYRKWRQKVKDMIVAWKKRRQREINEKLEFSGAE